MPGTWEDLSRWWWYDIYGLAILAPLWADSDFNYPDSKVLYQQYDSSLEYGCQDSALVNTVLARANEDAAAYAGFSKFETTWVLVVTWVNIHPRMWRSPHDQVCYCEWVILKPLQCCSGGLIELLQ